MWHHASSLLGLGTTIVILTISHCTLYKRQYYVSIYFYLYALGCKWQDKRFWTTGPNGSSHFQNLICPCFLMYAVLICLWQSQIFVIVSHLRGLLTLRPTILLAINESIVIFFLPFMPLPCQLISSAQTRSWCLLFNLSPSWFADTFIMACPRENLKATTIKKWNNWNAVILRTVHISNAERLASKFVTLRAKNLLTQMMESGYKKECTRFRQHMEGLYT